MARIAGVDIPRDKRVVISLTYVYGIGKSTAKEILKATGISEDVRVKDLTEEEITKIRKEVEKIKVEGDLRREVQLNIKAFNGNRKLQKVCVTVKRTSCSWSKTQTNARTRKGKARPIAGKEKIIGG